MEFDGGVLMVLVGLFAVVGVAFSVTDPNDLKILIDFKNGLDNPDLLKWPDNGDDPCGPPSWPHVFCSGNRVSQIQVQSLGLKGPLPQNLNQLTRLSNVGLQRNSFSGKLPSFSGLSELEFAYLDFNEFDTIPSDFFTGLSSVRVLALDYNPFNKTTGWAIPIELENSAQLTNLSLVNCNLVGAVPDFLGTLPSLMALKLSYNRLSGEVPASFGESPMQILWLNDQDGGGMTGSIDVIGKMASLTQLWLHGNQFSGTIPESIGNLTSLKDLNLNRNQIVGLIPQSLGSMELDKLDLSNNQLMGPIPTFRAGNVSCDSNSFCQDKAGVQCAPEVTALLDFLGGMNYPVSLTSQWSGNDPCGGSWLGLSCNPNSKVSIINLPRHNLTGTLSASVAKLGSLVEIRVGENNIHGTVPNNFTELESLRMLDISGNNLHPPLPKFHNSVKVVIDGNPLLVSNDQTVVSPSPAVNPPESSETPSDSPSQGGAVSPPSSKKDSPSRDMNSTSGLIQAKPDSNRHGRFILFAIVGCAAAGLSVLLVMIVTLFFCKKRKKLIDSPTSIVVQRKDPCDPRNMVKIAVSKKSSEGFSSQTVTSSGSSSSSVTRNAYGVEGGNLVISVQILRKVTNNFSNENELGSGGFGTVYKGEMEDGTKLAVKRMEGGVVTRKAVDEFQAEIAVLSKVRHRHLVSLVGYSVEGNERLLVYEFMPQGALSRHLFHWRSLKLEPLSWTRRLVIALDVARGIEYLHILARHTFIHRDLKSSNILLDDDFRAKVSDFGLVKLAPDGEKSVVTRLAGTFGYLAPEYAVMGKITTKVDVFSFGVVLMELLTGLTALDEERPEESRYLAEWFWRIKSSKEMLMAAIDPALEVNQETSKSISTIAELAGHCTARDPNHRPDMGHAVNVLSPLVETWKPVANEAEDCSGIDFSKPLSQMLKVWQASEGEGQSYTSTNDSTGSIPARPVGFADSFTSTDAR